MADLVETQVRLLGFPRSTRLPYDASLPLVAWLKANASQYDLIEVHGVFDFPALAAASLAKRLGVPFLVHPHGSLDPFDLRKHHTLKTALGRSWLRHLLAASESIVVTTAKEGERLETFGAVVHAEPLPLPYLCAPIHGDGDAFRKRVGAGNRRVVLFLGRVDYKKGLSYLIDAAARLSKEDIHFVIGGDASSKYAQGLMRTVELRGLTSVSFVGHLDNAAKADALAGSDILALVSDNENYGLVLVEAAHFGLPMLVSNEVYLSDELELLGAARIVGRNGDSVATALREVLGDDKVLRQMRAAARRAAGSIFDWERAGSAHEQFRQHLLTKRIGP